MSDKTPNAEYERYAPKWARVRDVMGGLDDVTEAAETYLPRLAGQSDDEYNAYKMRAHFLDATSKTEEAFRGLLFRTPINVDGDEDNETVVEFLADMDLQDADIDVIAEDIACEVMQTARYFAVVNFSKGLAPRPYIEFWKAEQILDWSTAFVNGAHNLNYIKLYEGFTADDGQSEPTEKVRELRLDPLSGTQYGYVVERFEKRETKAKTKNGRSNAKSEWVSLGIETPTKQQQPWPYIPAYMFGPLRGYDCVKPLLLGLADLNLSHYRTAADLEHGAHYTALPMPWIAGVDSDSAETFTIGASQAWVFENPQAKAGYLEFTGQGLGALENMLDRKQSMMAAEGARMLAPEKGQAESGFALQLRQGSEYATLYTLSSGISQGLTVLLLFMLDWAGVDADVTASVNRDFDSTTLGAQDITALLAAYQGGAISLETFLFNLRRGKRIDEQRTNEDEIEAIRDGDNASGRGNADRSEEGGAPRSDDAEGDLAET